MTSADEEIPRGDPKVFIFRVHYTSLPDSRLLVKNCNSAIAVQQRIYESRIVEINKRSSRYHAIVISQILW